MAENLAGHLTHLDGRIADRGNLGRSGLLSRSEDNPERVIIGENAEKRDHQWFLSIKLSPGWSVCINYPMMGSPSGGGIHNVSASSFYYRSVMILSFSITR